jgi:phosphatidylinositol-3-phosphatase
MGMLGFGVVLGSLVGGSAASPLSPVIVVSHASPQTAPPQTAASSGGGGGGGGGGTVTITTTTPAPPTSSSAASSSNSGSGSTTTTAASTDLPPIKHVFLIVLSSEGYNETFGHTADDPYLAKKLAKQGEVLVNYYAVTGSPLGNEIAMLSGQGPNSETAADCQTYDSFAAIGAGADGQELGSGCVYPATVQSLADQLTADKLTWKSYLQTQPTQKKAGLEQCHPRMGSSSGSQPTATQPYATWRNPFLFFRSLIPTACPKSDVALGQLGTDLKQTSTTPSLSYIVPDVCDDGSAVPCKPNAKTGMSAADAFLQSVVPEIERSPAYKADGMIAITFDNAPQSGPDADSSSCCDNPTYPNAPSATTTPASTTTTSTSTTPASTTPTTTTSASTTTTPASTTQTTTTSTAAATTTPTTTTSTTPTTATTTTPTTTTTSTTPTTSSTASSGGATNPTGGGGQVGLLVLSQFVKPNSLEVTDYFNHFSLLASIEKLFGLSRLGYAQDKALPVFGSNVFTNYSP